MSEQTNQPESKGGKLDGIAIGGTVLRKTHWPAKEGKAPSWSVELAYYGGKSFVNVSEAMFNRLAVNAYQMFLITQNAKGGNIYSTAIERG